MSYDVRKETSAISKRQLMFCLYLLKKTAASERAKVYAMQLSLVSRQNCKQNIATETTVDFLLRIFFCYLWKSERIIHNK